MYAIVDIETTGSYAAAHGITEISILISDGKKITEKFETLINPGMHIPRYITTLTGITNEMVADVPKFEEVASNIYNLLKDNIFVAHNVSFDYSFVLNHLKTAGYTLNCKKLCTVRFSRKIFPGLPSYSLGNLCRSLHIEMYNRHRAGGDCAATAEIFHLLLRTDRAGLLQKSLQRNSKEWILPPQVPKEQFDALPYSPGVYYFHNEKGKVVYVGKATNIRYRVNSHFSNNKDSRQKQNFMRHVFSISYQECATELMAFILESAEIKHRWPAFNASQKRWEDVYGIFLYEDQNGYQRFCIDKNRKRLHPLHTFHYLTEGHAMLRKLVKDFALCPKLCFLQKDNIACEGIVNKTCKGACEKKEKPAQYNKRVKKACKELQSQQGFAIIDKGLNGNDKSCILVCDGKFYGMGYIPFDFPIEKIEKLKPLLTLYKENSTIKNLISGFAARNPENVIPLSH